MSGMIVVEYRGGSLKHRLPDIPTAAVTLGHDADCFDVPEAGHRHLKCDPRTYVYVRDWKRAVGMLGDRAGIQEPPTLQRCDRVRP